MTKYVLDKTSSFFLCYWPSGLELIVPTRSFLWIFFNTLLVICSAPLNLKFCTIRVTVCCLFAFSRWLFGIFSFCRCHLNLSNSSAPRPNRVLKISSGFIVIAWRNTDSIVISQLCYHFWLWGPTQQVQSMTKIKNKIQSCISDQCL